MKQKVKRLIGILLSLVLVLSLMPAVSITVVADGSYTSLKNTTTVVHFDSKDWYLIDYDDSTVTLLTKECVAASQYNKSGYFVEYSNNPTVRSAVDNYYDNSISVDAKTAVSGGMFLLTTSQANAITNADVRKCSQFSGTDHNYWWLCSQGSPDSNAALVFGADGAVDDPGSDVNETLGVRPALKLNLAYVDFDSSSNTFTVNKYGPGITGLGTGAIENPTEPENDESPWLGNYVYYGKYGGTPTKYRVLDKASSNFVGNGKTLFLDCDTVLFEYQFRADREASDANQWSASDVRTKLNNASDEDSFLNKGFNTVERTAIAESTIAEHELADFVSQYVRSNFDREGKYYTPLAGDNIFLLDVEDILNPAYGYSSDCGYDGTWHDVDNHKKSGSNSVWRLRSPSSNHSYNAGSVNPDGRVLGKFVDSSYGISPAFNVSLSSVIFSSLISGTSDEYKLTLHDWNMNIKVTDGANINANHSNLTF